MGRKFTNCTAVRPSMKILEEGLIALDSSTENEVVADKYSRKYAAIRSYVLGEENKDLLELK